MVHNIGTACTAGNCVCKSGMFCVTFVIAQSAENDLNIMPQMGLFFKNGNFKNMVRTELSWSMETRLQTKMPN